jgi:hypothetical protein
MSLKSIPIISFAAYIYHMLAGEEPITISENISFEAVIDDTCERLRTRKVRSSLQKIREMEAVLLILEKELDMFILNNKKGSA